MNNRKPEKCESRCNPSGVYLGKRRQGWTGVDAPREKEPEKRLRLSTYDPRNVGHEKEDV